jgi:hypothetical protein
LGQESIGPACRANSRGVQANKLTWLSISELRIVPAEFQAEFNSTLSCEALKLIGEERAARFRDSSHSVLVPGFRKCRADEFFGDVLGDQPVEPARVPVAAYIEHFENETADSDLLRSS